MRPPRAGRARSGRRAGRCTPQQPNERNDGAYVGARRRRPRPHELDQRRRAALGQHSRDASADAAALRDPGGDEHVEDAVLLEAGRRVGVPDGVVQPGGELERQPRARAQRDAGRRRARPRSGRRRPWCRRCGTSPRASRRRPTRSRPSSKPRARDLEVAGQRRAAAPGCRRRLPRPSPSRCDATPPRRPASGRRRRRTRGARRGRRRRRRRRPATSRMLLVGRQVGAQLGRPARPGTGTGRRASRPAGPAYGGVLGQRLRPSGRCRAGRGRRRRRGR